MAYTGVSNYNTQDTLQSFISFHTVKGAGNFPTSYSEQYTKMLGGGGGSPHPIFFTFNEAKITESTKGSIRAVFSRSQVLGDLRVPESSESLLSGASSMSSSDISISSSRRIPISSSLWMFLISCGTGIHSVKLEGARGFN